MQPLSGLKVVDLTWVLPGFACTMILGDMGADVVKIEALREGMVAAPRAGAGVSPRGEEGKRIVAYDPYNRNKRSLPLNLRSEGGREIFYRLAEKSDVILEGFRPGVARRLKVDYQTVEKINPRIVYCSLSSYGQDGPYSSLLAHDPVMSAMGGALSLMGRPGEPPLLQSLGVWGDYVGGTLRATIGILLAIMAREKIGRGQYIDISMTEGVTWLMGRHLAEYFRSGALPRREELLNTGNFACHNVYLTRDEKYIVVGCSEAHFWEDLCRALGREDFVPYQWDMGAKREEAISAFAQAFRTKTREEWFQSLMERGIPVGKMLTLDEVVRDPQVRHRELVVEVEYPGLGKAPQIAPVVKLPLTPGKVRSPAPLFGQHTEEILGELGYREQDIQRLRKEGATA